jgi:hypothetical protein
MRTLEIDVRFDGGAVRIKKASGVTDRRTRDGMAAMLRLLWQQPAHRHLVLEVARPQAKRSIFDLYTAYLAGKLADLTPSFEDHELEALKDEWLGEFQASQSHKNTLRGVFKQLLAGVRFKAKLSDLPALLEQYRTKCVANGTPRAFNYAKMGCLALLRDKVGKRHPLRSNVADVPGMPEAKNGVKGMTIEQARIVRAALPEAAARIWWTMCCSGMGPTELWGEWTATADRVVIKGTKRPGRRWGSDGRQVPLLCAMTRPEMTVGHFQKLLRKAGATPYQGRKTFTRLMEKAGVPRTRRILYLGHGVKDITFLYEEYEITEFLAEDRTRLLKELGPENALQISRTQGLIVSQAKEA